MTSKLQALLTLNLLVSHKYRKKYIRLQLHSSHLVNRKDFWAVKYKSWVAKWAGRNRNRKWDIPTFELRRVVVGVCHADDEFT